ncbi:hypothetical protein MLD38_020448 [Melastoma candidum]|uniref:Uncharacterized protein n=1 Tax=Melastoma candidum TaxID=119954 RepID=A0ACB9QFZ8_9MYRT|nr:hypothetical protein MLD38_020448 [Melastoma candidum]
MYSSNLKGFILAVVSDAFISSSFIIMKKGLRPAGVNGPRASVGGYGYLLEPLWWIGMVTMIVGEIANFVAYIYAPAVLVTPLGALMGSTMIVLHAPQEQSIDSVIEIWELATQPGYEYKSNCIHHFCKCNNVQDLYTPLSQKLSWYIQGNGEVWKQKDEDGSPTFITVLRQDYIK